MRYWYVCFDYLVTNTSRECARSLWPASLGNGHLLPQVPNLTTFKSVAVPYQKVILTPDAKLDNFSKKVNLCRGRQEGVLFKCLLSGVKCFLNKFSKQTPITPRTRFSDKKPWIWAPYFFLVYKNVLLLQKTLKQSSPPPPAKINPLKNCPV